MGSLNGIAKESGPKMSASNDIYKTNSGPNMDASIIACAMIQSIIVYG